MVMAWRNVLSALLGAWFVVAAFVVNPAHSMRYQWTLLVLGGLTLIGGLWALGDAHKRPWRHWIMALCGLEVALAGWRYASVTVSTVWIGTISGLLAVVVAIWQAL